MHITPNIGNAVSVVEPPTMAPSPDAVSELARPAAVPRATISLVTDTSKTPTNADPESVIKAQIDARDPVEDPQKEGDIARVLEKMTEAAARRKTIMGLLPTSPSELSMVMSAVAAASSIDALADIKLAATATDVEAKYTQLEEYRKI